MKNFLSDKRTSGILAHITSLSSPFGIGDIGYSSYKFIEFLKKANQTYWQFLPTSPTNGVFGYSPYMSSSAFAGSPLLISPEKMVEDGLISSEYLNDSFDFSPYTTDFQQVSEFKQSMLQEGYSNFPLIHDSQYEEFIKETNWLTDYALFMTLKNIYGEKSWSEWPKEYVTRNKKSLERIRKDHKHQVEYYFFEQYIFYKQWKELHQYAKNAEIILFGDIPIYVGLDSADVWANQDIFTLSPITHQPTTVSGVPPDYFSKTGQRWGNPLYRWNSTDPQVIEKLEKWWTERFRLIFQNVDVARIDHFRAFESYWSIPEENKTAIDGEWLKGPGEQFFNVIEKNLGQLDIVAEDLGIITPEVGKLRDTLGFPGMKVLQFAFDGNPENSFLPHNFETSNCIVYTGTHDNDTTVGWYLSDLLDDNTRTFIKEYCNRRFQDDNSIHKDLIHLALSSTSKLSVFPLQDILGFGNDCKMNSPGIAEGNWIWRCAPEFMNQDVCNWLRDKTELFGRGRQEEQH